MEDYHKLVISVICVWGDSMVATAVGSKTDTQGQCACGGGWWRLHFLQWERGSAWAQIPGEALDSRFQDLKPKKKNHQVTQLRNGEEI